MKVSLAWAVLLGVNLCSAASSWGDVSSNALAKLNLRDVDFFDWNIIKREESGTCTDTTPCDNGACCSVSGYCGYSPSFCGTGNCTSNCDAKAECGEYAPDDDQDCPLNVCCSQYGFCGTSSDFCGTGCQDGYGTCGDVTAPSCSTSNSASKRSIAYYEAWSPTRPCDGLYPEDLNLEGFTQANFAFAYFDPSTFTMTAMDANSAELYSRFTGLKSNYSTLETWISVGGWSFSDPGSTQTAWSNMAASSANRAAFIQSLMQFMNTYGFDGVDLDWEYPGASDRGGTDDDGDNYVSLVKEMKAAFDGKYGISVTIPTSYWYLQNFKPVEMESYIDFFGLMAYDLHGVWDSTDEWTGPYIRPHTNLTEISEALDLLWRAGVTAGKVVLGEGWYGRSFTLSDPSCNTPNGVCEFTAGGNAGACSATSGILMNAEIQAVIDEYDADVVYDDVAAVKWITWDTTQWVSFDDEETYTQKKDFASDNCLGGLMVWAVDQNNQSTKTGFGSQSYSDASDTTTKFSNEKTVSEQAGLSCYTSQCGVDCRTGYNAVANMNGQPGSLSTNERCSGTQVESLCCADGTTMGTCTWRGWRGQGLPCSGGCNSGETLVAQNTNHHYKKNGKTVDQTCNGGLQSYCCDGFKAATSVTKTTKVSVYLSEEDTSPIISEVVATVTEAIADAAKSVLDEAATAFCDVAVPEFLAPIEAIELDIPILGEIAILAEDLLIPEIIKGCEEAIEDAGDAVLSWLGVTTSLTLSSQTVLTTSTSTDYICSPDTCVDGCSRKKRAERRDSLSAPAAVRTPPPKAIPAEKRTVSGYGTMDQPAEGELDAWFKKQWEGTVWETSVQDYEDSTAEFQPFGDEPLNMGVLGMYGCTALIMASKYGGYIAHFWEANFRAAKNGDDSAFNKHVIDQLGTASSAGMIGLSELPAGYFSGDDDFELTLTLYTPIQHGTSDARYPDQIAAMKTAIASYIDGLSEDDIGTTIYYATSLASQDVSIANGKVLIHYDNDIGSGKAAYMAWAGTLRDGTTTLASSDINTPILKAQWDQTDEQSS